MKKREASARPARPGGCKEASVGKGKASPLEKDLTASQSSVDQKGSEVLTISIYPKPEPAKRVYGTLTVGTHPQTPIGRTHPCAYRYRDFAFDDEKSVDPAKMTHSISDFWRRL